MAAIIFAMVIPTNAFANEKQEVIDTDYGKVKIEVLSANKVRISDEKDSEVIETNRQKNKIVSTIRDEKTGKESKLIFDKTTRTVYSSETGNTVTIDDVISSDSENGNMSLFASSKKVVKYISYKKIRQITSTGSSVKRIARVILFLAGVVETPLTAVGAISLVIGIIRAGMKSPSDSHGVKVTLKKKRHCRNRGLGRRCHTTYTFSSIGFY